MVLVFQNLGGRRFRGGLVFKAHGLLYHSNLGSRVIKKKRRKAKPASATRPPCTSGFGFRGVHVLVRVCVLCLRGVLASGFEIGGYG